MQRAAAMMVLCSIGLCGCGAGSTEAPRMHEVSGTVKFEGEPLESGAIILDSATGETIPVQGAINNGEFKFEAPPGPKIVRITASRETGEVDQYGEKVAESFIPARYNSESEMKRDVLEGEENVFEFDLEEDK